MKTSSAKQKGRLLQQWVCRYIKDLFGYKDGDVESRPMGSSGPDIMMASHVREDLRINIECKNTKIFPSISALKQAKENRPNIELYPAAIWHPPGKSMGESIIYMHVQDFFHLVRELKNDRKNT